MVDGANNLDMAKATGFSIGFNLSEIINRHVNFIIDGRGFRKIIMVFPKIAISYYITILLTDIKVLLLRNS